MAHVSFWQIVVYCVTAILLCYPVIVSNPIMQIEVRSNFINHHALLNALNALK